MKILIVTPFYYIEGRPDLKHDTNAIHYFAKYWNNDNEVKVFNVYPHSYKDIIRYKSKNNRKYYSDSYIFEKDNIEICLTEVQKLPGQKGKYNFMQCRHIMKQFNRWVSNNSFQPEIILVHVPSYAYVFIEEISKCFDAEIPILGILHKTDIEELERNSNVKKYLVSKFLYLYARSHGIKKKASLFKLSNLKQEIIQSGIPIQQSIGQTAPYTIDGDLQIIYVGKLIPLKHIDTIITAITLIDNKNIHLNIVGAGQEEKKLKELVGKFGLENQVTFVGSLPREQVFSNMARSNLFCMPSYPETLGLTYLEAMSVGCVPIGTMGEGIDGIIIDNENGFLVNTDHLVDELVSKINTYRKMSDDDRKQMSNNARATVMQLDEQTCAAAYLELVRGSVENVRKNK